MESDFRDRLKEKDLKITPQRVVIFDAILQLKNHPSAENITECSKINLTNISVWTVYKGLDIFDEIELFNKVKTENDIMRYDYYISKHYHLYRKETDMKEDYEDEKLNGFITDYFKIIK